MLKLGTETISALYVGGTKIKRALVGETVVYEAVRPPAVYTISAAVAPASGGSATGAGQYQEGETVTLTYTPAEDYRFTGWYAGSTLLSQANPYAFTATQDIAVTAKCEEIPTYTLTLAPTGISAQNWSFSIIVNGGGVSWSGSGAAASSPAPRSAMVKEGSVTVQATSPDRYEFAGWQVGSGSVVTSNPYTFTVAGDATLYCRYAKKSRLPAGYTEVEYLIPYTTGAVMLGSTAIAINNTFRFEVDCSIDTQTTTARIFNCSGTTTYTYPPFISVNSSGGIGYLALLSTSSTLTFSSPFGARKKWILDLPNKTLSIGAESKTISVGTTSVNAYIYVGYANTSRSAQGKYYGMKIYKGSTLLYDLVPCMNVSNLTGFYDLVKKTFYQSPSSKQWTAGPAV